jgi:hypothetical protein
MELIISLVFLYSLLGNFNCEYVLIDTDGVCSTYGLSGLNNFHICMWEQINIESSENEVILKYFHFRNKVNPCYECLLHNELITRTFPTSKPFEQCMGNKCLQVEVKMDRVYARSDDIYQDVGYTFEKGKLVIIKGRWFYSCHSYYYGEDTAGSSIVNPGSDRVHFKTTSTEPHFNNMKTNLRVYINMNRENLIYRANNPSLFININSQIDDKILFSNIFSPKKIFNQIDLKPSIIIVDKNLLTLKLEGQYYDLLYEITVVYDKSLFDLLSYSYNNNLLTVSGLDKVKETILSTLKWNTDIIDGVIVFIPTSSLIDPFSFSDEIKVNQIQFNNDIFTSYQYLNIIYSHQGITLFSETQKNPFNRFSNKKVYQLTKTIQNISIPINPSSSNLISFWYNISSKSSYIQLKLCFKNSILLHEIIFKFSKMAIDLSLTSKGTTLKKESLKLTRTQVWNYIFVYQSIDQRGTNYKLQIDLYLESAESYDKKSFYFDTGVDVNQNGYDLLYASLNSSTGGDKVHGYSHLITDNSLPVDDTTVINSLKYYSPNLSEKVIFDSAVNCSDMIMASHQGDLVYILNEQFLDKSSSFLNIFYQGYPKVVITPGSKTNYYNLIIKFDGEIWLKSRPTGLEVFDTDMRRIGGDTIGFGEISINIDISVRVLQIIVTLEGDRKYQFYMNLNNEIRHRIVTEYDSNGNDNCEIWSSIMNETTDSAYSALVKFNSFTHSGNTIDLSLSTNLGPLIFDNLDVNLISDDYVSSNTALSKTGKIQTDLYNDTRVNKLTYFGSFSLKLGYKPNIYPVIFKIDSKYFNHSGYCSYKDTTVALSQDYVTPTSSKLKLYVKLETAIENISVKLINLEGKVSSLGCEFNSKDRDLSIFDLEIKLPGNVYKVTPLLKETNKIEILCIYSLK